MNPAEWVRRARLAVATALLGLSLGAGCQAPPHEPSVRQGVNDSYKDPNLSVDEWVKKFEIESREIYADREDIVRAVALTPGAAVADIGAGTGLFTALFCKAVGQNGRVYAVDIVPRFIEHIQQRAKEQGCTNVRTLQCHEDSTDLPADSIDVAFICDTYHHFEYPRSTMRTVYRALRPGGTLVVIDFRRIPGVSRAWVLDHVRAGQEVVTTEITGDGFRFVEEVPLPDLKENYGLRFRKPK